MCVTLPWTRKYTYEKKASLVQNFMHVLIRQQLISQKHRWRFEWNGFSGR